MTDNDVTQINVRLDKAQMEQLKVLSTRYGSISATVRIALDNLWRDLVRSGQIRPSIPDHYAEDANTDAFPQVNEPDI